MSGVPQAMDAGEWPGLQQGPASYWEAKAVLIVSRASFAKRM